MSSVETGVRLRHRRSECKTSTVAVGPPIKTVRSMTRRAVGFELGKSLHKYRRAAPVVGMVIARVLIHN
jgi:hypothetical protein